MAKKRRTSPTEKDFERIAETLINDDTFKKIVDYDSFLEAYKKYFEDNPEMINKEFEDSVFKDVLEFSARVHDTRGIKKKEYRVVREKKGKEVYQLIDTSPTKKREANIFKIRGYINQFRAQIKSSKEAHILVNKEKLSFVLKNLKRYV